MFLSILNNTKNPKNENTNMNWKNKITKRLILGVSKGVEGCKIMIKRGAALPEAVVLYLYKVLCISFFFSSWSMSFFKDSMF